ncbi:bromodomain-containing protein 8 isoform X1 [Ceratitis capitata]|uniref:(Mediterranean fruit fly) hypothetical protein n=1 Tax=Ceratitis capitata TaxID=7213 RepID=A0A811UB29_CERCA|nr:bromodomain-containing protein 8 isoform X1 [Ceratitis capitata]CAD6994523.1 unnamed protein product [Ceratitis capitata]
MASSAQERLPLNRLPLDKWTTREQLCLASAVSCSGDQNWMTVSRTLKLVCGNGTTNRPADWYSQKNCAVQYGHLLENVETPKRKKRTSESASGISSPAVVETPTDLVLRRLNEERVQEIKAEIRRGQEEFALIYKDLKALQSGTLSENELREMLGNIELQQEQERVEEMKIENQMREREQQRMEFQRNWRTLTPATPPIPSTAPANATDTATLDMDIEDIVGGSSPSGQSINNSNSHSQQKQSTAQTGTSPLLSSLLKTPTSNANVTTTVSTNNTSGSANNFTRSSAPTITTLLTSGSIPNKNQPLITLKANIPPQKAAQLLTSPISGPPSVASVPASSIAQQNLLSPSQAAPTLSMLLEKNKASANATTNIENQGEGLSHKDFEIVGQTQMPVISNVSDSNNDEIPMELDDEISSHVNDTDLNKAIVNDSDDPDPNEEQQLMEVFKNIGNIDELDIDVSAVIDDEEVDFLKDMGADSPPEMTDVTEFENKEDLVENNLVTTNDFIKDSDADNIEINEKANSKTDSEGVGTTPVEANSTTANSGDNRSRKIETTSSDDSNDNIPLAAVASIEQRAAQEKEKVVDTSLKNERNGESNESNKGQDDNNPNSFDEEKEHDKLEKQLADLVGASEMDDPKNLGEDGKSPLISECSDVIVIPTDDDDSNGDKVKETNEKSTVDEEAAKIKKDLETEIDAIIDESRHSADHHDETTEADKIFTSHEAVAPLPPIISIADTDEDSSTTDVSIVTRKDDKLGTSSIKHSAPQPRKSLHETPRQDQQNKTDDESTTQFSSSSSSSVTQARQPMLRKLRDRDRSESPMIDADLHPANSSAITSVIDNLNSQRLRRRYSSTPVNDSIPNSPASSDRERDETETRISKKSLLSIFHALQYSKNASTLQRCFHEDLQFDEICLRPMDMLSIRKQIEAGTIRNVSELQRDILLMCQNGLMLFKQNSTGFNAASAFMQECQGIREFVVNTNSTEIVAQSKDNKEVNKSSNTSGTSSRKSGSRKSQRIILT